MGPIFETTFATLIMANAIVMAAETQYSGMDVGFQISYGRFDRSASDEWPGAEAAFAVFGNVFGYCFVLELLLKMVAMGPKFVFSWWNWLDTIIVGSWCLESVLGGDTPLNPMMLRLFRLVKLLRVAKLFKQFQAFDSLSLLIGSLKASASILCWSIVVIFILQMVASLFFCQVLLGYMEGSSPVEGKFMVYKSFGTFTRAFITMFELTIGQWGPICHMLVENVNEGYAIIIVLYVVFVSFATMNVIRAVFILETQKLASSDEDILIMEKERQNQRLDANIAAVFKEIDGTGDGNMDFEEFNEVLNDHRVVTWLAALELDVGHCEGLFSLMDDGDGHISFHEFVAGVHRLKGAAKSIDVINMASKLKDVEKLLIQSLEGTEPRADSETASPSHAHQGDEFESSDAA